MYTDPKPGADVLEKRRLCIRQNDRIAEKSDSCHFLPGWERDESRIDRFEARPPSPLLFSTASRLPFRASRRFPSYRFGERRGDREGRPRDPMFRQGLIFKALFGILRFQIA